MVCAPVNGSLLFMFDVSKISFFFQAEDGIRDHCVTGVQTCALPIYGGLFPGREAVRQIQARRLDGRGWRDRRKRGKDKIGRASCRERV